MESLHRSGLYPVSGLCWMHVEISPSLTACALSVLEHALSGLVDFLMQSSHSSFVLIWGNNRRKKNFEVLGVLLCLVGEVSWWELFVFLQMVGGVVGVITGQVAWTGQACLKNKTKQKWLNWFAAPWLFCDDFHLFQTSFTLFSFKFCFIFLLYDSFVSLSLRSTCPCIASVWSLFTNEELLDTGNKPCYLKSSSFIEN